MSKLLPLEYPPITSYPIIANIFTVLWSRKNQILPWLADHYIQLHATWHSYGGMWFNFYDADFLYKIHPADYCPYILTQKIDKTSFKRIFNLTDFIEEQINNNYYIIIYLNQFFLPFSQHFNIDNHMHPTFIWGYDRCKNIVHVSDFYDNGKYVSRIATYDEINKSYNYDHLGSDVHQAFHTITLYKFVKSNYRVNIDLLKQTISDYVMGIDSAHRYLNSVQFQYTNSKTDNSDYGINCYNMLREHLDYYGQAGEDIDVRAFHLLYDHKVAMQIRLQYLVESKYISVIDKNNLLSLCEKLIKDSVILRNLALKYKLCREKNTIAILNDKSKSLQKNDFEFMSLFLQALQ